MRERERKRKTHYLRRRSLPLVGGVEWIDRRGIWCVVSDQEGEENE